MPRAPRNPTFDTFAAAVEALRSGGGGNGQPPRLNVVAFCDKWQPPALATASALETVRAEGAVQAFASIFLIDATAERDAAHEAGVLATPALLFYWEAEPAIVRRPAWEDDCKFSGAAPAERLVEIIRHARDCCAKHAAAIHFSRPAKQSSIAAEPRLWTC